MSAFIVFSLLYHNNTQAFAPDAAPPPSFHLLHRTRAVLVKPTLTSEKLCFAAESRMDSLSPACEVRISVPISRFVILCAGRIWDSGGALLEGGLVQEAALEFSFHEDLHVVLFWHVGLVHPNVCEGVGAGSKGRRVKRILGGNQKVSVCWCLASIFICIMWSFVVRIKAAQPVLGVEGAALLQHLLCD